MTRSGNYSQAQLVDAMKKEVKKIVKNKKKFKFFKGAAKRSMQESLLKAEALKSF